MNITVFWDVVSCSLGEIDRSIRGAYCLHPQGNTPVNRHLNTAMKTLNLSCKMYLSTGEFL
jgi:hypothetical protein